MTPQERTLQTRLAAHTKWAKTPDRGAALAPARAGLLARFERDVDPDGTLDPATRATLAESARRAFYARIALKAAQTRRSRRGGVAA